MRKLIVAAAVAGVASFGGLRKVEAQAFYPKTPTSQPATRGGSGVYSGGYGAYPNRDDDQNSRPKHAKKHKHKNKDHKKYKKHNANERGDNDADDRDDSRSGAHGQSGYGTQVPARVNPGYGRATASGVPSRVPVPNGAPWSQSRSRGRGHDQRRGDRDR